LIDKYQNLIIEYKTGLKLLEQKIEVLEENFSPISLKKVLGVFTSVTGRVESLEKLDDSAVLSETVQIPNSKDYFHKLRQELGDKTKVFMSSSVASEDSKRKHNSLLL